jgi:hypothetical protein
MSWNIKEIIETTCTVQQWKSNNPSSPWRWRRGYNFNSLTSTATDHVCATPPLLYVRNCILSIPRGFTSYLQFILLTNGSSAPSEIPQRQQLLNVIIRKWRHFRDVALLPCACLPTFRSEFHGQAPPPPFPRMAWEWGTYHTVTAVTHLEQHWTLSNNAVTTTSNRFFF